MEVNAKVLLSRQERAETWRKGRTLSKAAGSGERSVERHQVLPRVTAERRGLTDESQDITKLVAFPRNRDISDSNVKDIEDPVRQNTLDD